MMASTSSLIESVQFGRKLCKHSSNLVRLCHLTTQTGPIFAPDGSEIQLTETESKSKDGVYIVLKLIRSCHDKGTEGQIKNDEIAKNEFDMLWNNQHPNIVRAFQLVPMKDMIRLRPEIEFPGFFMECGGASLYQVLHEEAASYPSSSESFLPQCLNWMRQAAAGLQFLHSKNVMHRDVKSHNMLLFNRGTVLKLCDLELAKDITNDMTANRGTWAWMAPEILTSQTMKMSYGKEVDVYSYGMTLFECLFRKTPFTGLGMKTLVDMVKGETLDDRQQPVAVRVNRSHVEADGRNVMKIEFDWTQAEWQNIKTEIKDLLEKLVSFQSQDRPEISVAYEILRRETGGDAPAAELIKAPMPEDDTCTRTGYEIAGIKVTQQPMYIVSFNASATSRVRALVADCERLSAEDCETLRSILASFAACIQNTLGLTVKLSMDVRRQQNLQSPPHPQQRRVSQLQQQQMPLQQQHEEPQQQQQQHRGPQQQDSTPQVPESRPELPPLERLQISGSTFEFGLTGGRVRPNGEHLAEIARLVYGDCQRLMSKAVIFKFV